MIFPLLPDHWDSPQYYPLLKYANNMKMKIFFPTISFLLFLTIISGCRKSQPPAVDPSNTDSLYKEKFDQAYGTDSLQTFDLYLPEGRSQQTKTIILIHGGGWVSGEKAYCKYYAVRFAGFGFAAISMNYRLANNSVHYDDMLDDIGSMIECVLNNAGQWGIGASEIALFGYSAGGHLALLYSYSRNSDRKITSVISLAGPTDVQDSLLWIYPGLYDEIKLMTGDSSPENWAQANPIHYISSAMPSTFLIHGTIDSVVPFSQSVKLSQAMKKAFAHQKLLLMENQTHYFSPEATERMLVETKDFLLLPQ
ncbi:MAG: alpha/beta hydrolase [Bacteroidetes bacterium]|nr:alpha/beta hydrolase [Bacteroidota bacterium]